MQGKETIITFDGKVIDVHSKAKTGGLVSCNSYLWKRLEFQQWKGERAKKLSEEKKRNFHYVAESILRSLFDLASDGLGHKLALLVKLTETEDLTKKDRRRLCSENPPAISNFYVCLHIRNPAKREREDFIVPSWFYEHFSNNKRFQSIYDKVSKLNEEVDVAGIDDLSYLAYKDLYCMYELAGLGINFINNRAVGVVKGRFRPTDHRRERDNAWKNSELLSGLKERFDWVRSGQPNLQELLEATRQVLVEKKSEFGFEEEISPLPVLG